MLLPNLPKEQAMSHAISDLIFLSQLIGNQTSYVQGTGGNISIKEGDILHIKASGFRLDALSTHQGIVSLPYPTIAEAVTKKLPTEVYEEIVATANHGNTLKPSMETGFHACLGKAVIHTHSVWANAFLCTTEAETYLPTVEGFLQHKTSKFYVFYIPSEGLTPGLALSQKVAEILTANKVNLNSESVVFLLQNHGLIISSPTAEEALKVHHWVNEAFKEMLPSGLTFQGISLYSSNLTHTLNLQNQYHKAEKIFWAKPEDFLLMQVLCPDQAIFFHQFFSHKLKALSPESGSIHFQSSPAEAQAIAEMFAALLFIHEHTNLARLNLVFLAETLVAEILNLPIEKYRQQLLK